MKEITIEQAKEMIGSAKAGDLTLLDVRQPWEYEEFHLPGAMLIPLPELPDKLGILAEDMPVLVYCRSGGRSRAGAMLLDGAGYTNVYSLLGGTMAWDGDVAVGPVSSGLETMLSARTVRDALLTAYAMETFLQGFYNRLRDAAGDADVRAMFERLAKFEDGHKNSIYERYTRHEPSPLERSAFEAATTVIAAEGGVDPDAFLTEQGAALDTVRDVLDVAMMFEAQALDFYQRASRSLEDKSLSRLLIGLAREEQAHLKVLATFMDTQA